MGYVTFKIRQLDSISPEAPYRRKLSPVDGIRDFQNTTTCLHIAWGTIQTKTITSGRDTWLSKYDNLSPYRLRHHTDENYHQWTGYVTFKIRQLVSISPEAPYRRKLSPVDGIRDFENTTTLHIAWGTIQTKTIRIRDFQKRDFQNTMTCLHIAWGHHTDENYHQWTGYVTFKIRWLVSISPEASIIQTKTNQTTVYQVESQVSRSRLSFLGRQTSWHSAVI